MEMKASVTGDGSNGEGSNVSEDIDDKASKYTGQPELQQQQFGWRRFKQWFDSIEKSFPKMSEFKDSLLLRGHFRSGAWPNN
jgi:hypothetical protein